VLDDDQIAADPVYVRTLYLAGHSGFGLVAALAFGSFWAGPDRPPFLRLLTTPKQSCLQPD
jgi:hypothetical protein